MVLDKKASLYDRDENGELVPVEVKLELDENDESLDEYVEETIKIVPIPRGKIKRLFAKIETADDEKDLDGDLISEHCFVPKYTREEIAHIKPSLATAIVNTIFRESGLAVGKSKKRAVREAEDDFAKN